VAYGVGLYTALYYVYYVYSEFDIGHLKFFTLRHLMIILISAFIFFFVLPLIIWQDIGIAKYSFIFIPVAVAIAFLVKISTPLIELYKEKGGATNRFYRDRIATGYLTLLSIVLMPIIVALGDFQVVEQLTVNGGYFVLAVALIRINIYQDLKKEQFLHRLGYTDDAREAKNIAILKYFSKLDLSKREIEVANLILEGKSYKQIGSYLFIAEGTVSKHASNIFKKAEVQNRREFERRFKGKRK
jgi:DNA-binding CsgD family transcriptional regulator